MLERLNLTRHHTVRARPGCPYMSGWPIICNVPLVRGNVQCCQCGHGLTCIVRQHACMGRSLALAS
eukprot:361921-Chlamydomonas_euryale.AAC.12